MELDKKGIDLLAKLEGLRLNAYKCTADVWTIGLGNTFYENGEKVKEGDKVTLEKAYHLFSVIALEFEKAIDDNVKVVINQNQFNSLFIFAYNVGIFGFKNSTLLKRVNIDPNDKKQISFSFMLWKGKTKNAKGKFILESRRLAEIENYFLS